MKKYKIFNKKISGPFTIPSGIVATEASTLEKIANEIPEIGILTTKSIGIEPREGNREPIIAQYSPFSFINAVGLTNPGAEEFARRLAGIKIPDDKFLLISIFGSNENEFKEIAEKLFTYADGFEINISCPHSDKYGQIIGQDNNLVGKIVRNISSLGKPVLVKISPNLAIKETVKYAIKAGAFGITAINTKGPEMFLRDNHTVLTNKRGGVSGKAILEIGLNCVKEIREITDLPIIACAGISTREEVERYKEAGADFFGIGSALAGMNTKEIKQYFHDLLIDLEKGTNRAAIFLKEKLNMDYQKYRVMENKPLNEDLSLLRLNGQIEAEPGQFIFAWLPEKGEKPFSVFDDSPLTLLIQKKGCFTKELLNLKKGETLYIRGPYGNSPKIEGKVLLVGGGSGIAGLYLFAKRNKNTISLLGAKDKNHLAYLEKFRVYSKTLYSTTEKGDMGDKGLVTDRLGEIIEKEKPDYCINCGPEAMVREAIQKESKDIDQERIYSSIEFLTKCGIGLCGSCATSKGWRSCVDGTFFPQSRF
ncbi:MAG: dihydroorotate dehydrogenase [Candidatus Nealsonbacteria bacterium]|nr:dihydroorotate dehydrogenase [Candidatus Nealsonbacteria bacterium]